MRQIKRQIKRTLKCGSIAAILILGGWLYVLAYPSFLFAHEKEFGSFTVYSDAPIGPAVDSVMADVKTWLEPISIYNAESEVDIYLCHDENQFGKISRFTLRKSTVMGFNLPELNNCIINVFAIRNFGRLTDGLPPYHTREGNLAHVVTHELMHQYLADRYGSISARSLPIWKTEGYCEYGANFVRTRTDGVSLADRMSVYSDPAQWNKTAVTHRGHYLWGILIEYLVSVRGLSLEEVMDKSVTKSGTLTELKQWLSEQERTATSV